MSDSDLTLAPRTPFWQLPAASAADPDLLVSDRAELGLAVMLARKGQQSALAQCIRRKVDIELPSGPRRSAQGDFALAGIGPGAWLATDERRGRALAARLRDLSGELASISDQSDGYAVLRFEGPKVRSALEKLVPIDLHPQQFKADDVAVTAAGPIGVTLWRLDDTRSGASVFEVAIYRSMAADFGRLLSESVAVFGP